MQRPESALFRRAFHYLSSEVCRVSSNGEVAEDEARCARYDQSLQNQRLNLSRKPLAPASSEIAVVTNLDRCVGLTQHIPLRAHPLVHADDLGGQLNDLLLLGLLLWSRNLLLRFRSLFLILPLNFARRRRLLLLLSDCRLSLNPLRCRCSRGLALSARSAGNPN